LQRIARSFKHGSNSFSIICSLYACWMTANGKQFNAQPSLSRFLSMHLLELSPVSFGGFF
jgi:hypothetical protein